MNREDFLLEINGENEQPLVFINNYGLEEGIRVEFVASDSNEPHFLERGLSNILKESRRLYDQTLTMFYVQVLEFFKGYEQDFKEKFPHASLVWRVDVEEDVCFVTVKGKCNEDIAYDFLENLIDDFKYIFDTYLKNEYEPIH